MRSAVALLAVVWLAAIAAAQEFHTGGPLSPAGTRATCDIPKEQHLRNTGGLGRGGPGTGSGLCVFTSCELASRWQSANLDGFQKWMTNREGGGWPQKLDQMLTAFCREKKVSIPEYIQHTGGDEDFLDLAIRTGRMPSVTYAGMDDFYGTNQKIAHMVDLAHLDRDSAAIIDNNRPGAWVWMTRAQFLKRWREMNGGWAVVFLGPPPPVYAEAPMSFEQLLPWRRNQCPPGGCRTPFIAPAAPFVVEPAAPIAEPEPAPIEVVPPVNYGIDPAKVHGDKKWFLNGAAVEREDAMQALGLSDDSARWHLAAVGSAEYLAKFRAAVAALDPIARAKVHVQAYPPDHWAVRQFELPYGVSIRKPGPSRTGTIAGQIAGDVSPVVLQRFVADAFDPPKPMPAPTPAPAPEPAPGPQPAPAPAPAPPSNEVPLWVLALIAALTALALRRKS